MLDEHFVRQRRNLILMSALVLVVNLGQASLDRISLLGNEIVFSNPATLPTILGVVLGYLLIRYLQYAHEIEDKGFSSRFYRRVEKTLAPRLLKREFKRSGSWINPPYQELRSVEIESFLMFDEHVRPGYAEMEVVGKEGGQVLEHTVPVSWHELVLPFIVAASYVCIRTRLVTDFAFPLAFAGAAFASFSGSVSSAAAGVL